MPDRPNVVWIMADQHNAKCTGWGSFPTAVETPHLERLAGEGVRFDRAFCQNPICTPSRVSYLTGQYPTNHGYYGNGGSCREALPTLFSVADRLGYRTGRFGKDHTPSGLIDDHVDRATGRGEQREYLRGRDRLEDFDLPAMRDGMLDARESDLPFEDHLEHYVTERLFDFVRDGDGPFFSWLSLNRPHPHYVPASEFWERYPPADLTLAPSATEDHEAGGKPPHHRQGHPLATPEVFSAMDEESPWAKFEPRDNEALLERQLQGYLGCITEIDALVGRVLDFLEREGLREDTIVVYCADHGDFASEHGFPEKAPGVSYDAISRVPFVWSWPGEFEADAVVEDLVETVDVFPTLATLMGADRPDSADGEDLTGYLTGGRTEPIREYAITENPWTRCVRTETQKLTIYPRGFFGSGSEEFLEFYDLEDDPWETENLAVTQPESYADAIEHHRRLLYDFLATQRRPRTLLGNLDDFDVSDDGTGRLSPATIQSLLEEADFKRNYT
jgi:choline-sulfatase/uncharacterized sulfatase